MTKRRPFLLTAWLFVLLIAAVPVAGSLAQSEPEGSLAARVSEGDCETPDLRPIVDMPDATPEAGGQDGVMPLSFAASVDVAYADIVTEPHVVVIERSDGELAAMIACGVVQGDPDTDRVVSGLFSTDTGELAGVAVVAADDEDAGTVSVVVFLMMAGDAPGLGEDAGETAEPTVVADDVLDNPQEPVDEQADAEGGI